MADRFEPKITGFVCKWCTSAGADLAGTSRKVYPPNMTPIMFFCSGRIDPQHIIWAFRNGADGVFIGGCHPGDCHYQNGNYKTMRRIPMVCRLMSDMGIEADRLHLEWVSASEGDKFTKVIAQFIDQVRALGPLRLPELNRKVS